MSITTKKNKFLLNSKTNLISNAYSNKDWNLDFTSTLTLDNKKSDNIGDFVDQKTTVNTISLDKTLIDFGNLLMPSKPFFSASFRE